MSNIKNELKQILKNNQDILISELEGYGSHVAQKVKTMRNCCFCPSSDAINVYYKNNSYWYYCHSCKNGGDVINLVMEKENCDFDDALIHLNQKYGLGFDIKKSKKVSNFKPYKDFYDTKIEELEKDYNAALEQKDLDLALEIRTNINNLKEIQSVKRKIKSIGDKINYSNYNVNETNFIEKYISENDYSIKDAIEKAEAGETILLIADTGTGKTYSVINNLKQKNIKAIFVVPNAINVSQISSEYDIKGACGDISISKVIEDNTGVITMTWDKFGQVSADDLKDYIVILDEVHQIYIDMFRSHKINKLTKKLSSCKGSIHITATPNKLNFEIYDYIIEYKQTQKTKYNVYLYNQIDDKKILKIAKYSKKFALLKDDKKFLDFVKSNLGGSIDVITSDTRGFSNSYKQIIEYSNIKGFTGICNTSVLVAGVNINEKDITDIIIVGEKDIATIKQYVARFRDLVEVNVHIFNNYKTEKSAIYDIEWLISKITTEIQDELDYYNRYKPNNFVREIIDIKPFRLENSNMYFYDTETQKYIISNTGIRNKCYMDYYNNTSITAFATLLEEYFSNVNIQKNNEIPENKLIKKYCSDVKILKSNALEILEKEKNMLVGAVQILTGNIDNKLKKYVETVEKTTIEDKKQKLIDLGIEDLLLVSNIAKIINIYTKYVVEKGYSYNVAWSVATMGNRARGKFFAKLNNMTYRKIAKKYPTLINDETEESKLYQQIINVFKLGCSYTTEHLDMFIESYKNLNPYTKLTKTELQEKINTIFNLERKEYRKELPKGKYIFDYIPKNKKNKTYVFTITSFISLGSFAAEYKFTDLDTKILKNLLNEKIKKADKTAIEIEKIFSIWA